MEPKSASAIQFIDEIILLLEKGNQTIFSITERLCALLLYLRICDKSYESSNICSVATTVGKTNTMKLCFTGCTIDFLTNSRIAILCLENMSEQRIVVLSNASSVIKSGYTTILKKGDIFVLSTSYDILFEQTSIQMGTTASKYIFVILHKKTDLINPISMSLKPSIIDCNKFLQK
ncbi:hypothetical protein DP163_gp012 [Sea otter poxvirus]|uniref:Uncharacterized protein n=1 Tax=Sea otter poxvirus TaxID=1416741 RepID=A0A2U9QHK5_9POXV|nr:hypothetical protein DP163_gp012 [Sea otter poxvirus]AWU47057.1 hypothetical protein [Sea otter poxvirus]